MTLDPNPDEMGPGRSGGRTTESTDAVLVARLEKSESPSPMARAPQQGVSFSFVIPFLNEEGTLRELYERIRKVGEESARIGDFEVIFVDDGSTDGGTRVVEELLAEYSNVILLQLQGNFGKAAALAAGFGATSGDIVMTLDADLQDDPKEIPRFLEELDRGYDVVSGHKLKRHDPWHKVFPSRVFNWMVRMMTGTRLHDVNCGFKAYRRSVLENVRLYGSLHRFIPVLAHWKRFRISEIVVEHHARTHGVSKYGGGRFFRGVMDLSTVCFLLRYERRPAHFFGLLGIPCTLAGTAINLHLSLLWLQGERIGHRPLLTLGVLLMVVGVQFLAAGFVAELLVHFTSPQRPYVLKRELRSRPKASDDSR